MKIKREYTFKKPGLEGSEFFFNMSVEENFEEDFSEEKMTLQIQKEFETFGKSMQKGLNPAILVNTNQKQLEEQKDTKFNNRQKTKRYSSGAAAKNKSNKVKKGDWKASDNQLVMVNTIVPMMGKTVQEVLNEYGLSSESELTHNHVAEIKDNFDLYKENNPGRFLQS